jgi:hypothetical protein
MAAYARADISNSHKHRTFLLAHHTLPEGGFTPNATVVSLTMSLSGVDRKVRHAFHGGNMRLCCLRFSTMVLLAFLCTAVEDVAATHQEKTGSLSAEQKKLLSSILKDLVFDPTGAQYVVAHVNYRTLEGQMNWRPRDGWLVCGKVGEPDRVYFMDGEWRLTSRLKGLQKGRVHFSAPRRHSYPVHYDAGGRSPSARWP